MDDVLKQYEVGPVAFSGQADALYERHLTFDDVVALEDAGMRERYEAMACSIRDVLSQRWIKTEKSYEAGNVKRVYYLSMEYLIGRSLANNAISLLLPALIRDTLAREHIDRVKLVAEEPDAGLGNGGLGRLAACIMDSLATLQIPAMGYGLRYEYGIFRQAIKEGFQVEQPDNWLRYPDPWEVARPDDSVAVHLASGLRVQDGALHLVPGRTTTLLGSAYDRPVVGYAGKTISTLRLWAAVSPDYFDLGAFSRGDLLGALQESVAAASLTRVLYPDDSTEVGRDLRFVQEYFLVACSLADIVRRFLRKNTDWDAFPDKVAAQLNDTHPSLAVPELMRILLDDVRLGWDQAWSITTRTLAYTNHTLLPEAMEKWPVRLFESLTPRLLEIIYEINHRLLDSVRTRFPSDEARVQRTSLFEEGPDKKVRMAHLAIVGTHSTNGVAEIHSQLLRTTVVRDMAEMFPERFGSKTNGVTPRRWLLACNPALANVITDAIGESWITDLMQLRHLKPLTEDDSFRDLFRQAKRTAKLRFAGWLTQAYGETVDLDTIFDSQIKRIHEYKRQLLNALHIVMLYGRLRSDPNLDIPPRTFFFAGKAAPAYTLAKLIIKFINNLAATIAADPAMRGRLKVLFLPEYNVSVAERLIPASDVSEQLSTAGYEASGTSNMKFMMNGALTIGTRDGATIEMAQEAGEENLFLFGLTADQVKTSRGWYNPRWHYDHDPEIHEALDMISSDVFSRGEPGIFSPLCDTLLAHGDYYMHLADLQSYAQAQAQVGALYANRDEWTRKAILNVASSGKFSADRTVAQYASEIWHVTPFPVE